MSGLKYKNLQGLIKEELPTSTKTIKSLYTLDVSIKPMEVDELKSMLGVDYIGLGRYDLTTLVEEIYLKHYTNTLVVKKRNKFHYLEKAITFIKSLFVDQYTVLKSQTAAIESMKAYNRVRRTLERCLRSCEVGLEEAVLEGKKFHPVREGKYFTVELDEIRGTLEFTFSVEETVKEK